MPRNESTRPQELYERLSENYRKGPLRLLSSKYFLTCRVAITCAFASDFSREISDTELDSALRSVVRRLTEIDDELVPGHGRPENARIAQLRRLCIDSGYLFSSSPDARSEPTWRVTPDARRAFEATDALAQTHSSGFTSARLEMIRDQLEQIEIDLTQSRSERAKRIQAQIDRLVRERDAELTGTAEEMDEGRLVDRVEQLHELMRNLPTDVETVAYQTSGHVSELTKQLDTRTASLSSVITDFNASNFDVLAHSDEGKSYADALRIMTSDEMEQILDRLIDVESNDKVKQKIGYGYLSHAWDDLLRSIDHVQNVNREGSSVVVKAVHRKTSRAGATGAALRGSALSALDADPTLVSRIELPLPWSYPMRNDDIRLSFKKTKELSYAPITPTTPAPEDEVDMARMAILAGPAIARRASELLDTTIALDDDDTILVSHIVNAQPPKARRIVEWAGFITWSARDDVAVADECEWHLVDSNGTETVWRAPEVVTTRRALKKILRAKKSVLS